MENSTSLKKPTKERILDAAFSFCNEPRFNTFSLSELAAKVGISKTAIYRHYKNKDAVYAAMYERFLEKLTECMSGMEKGRLQNGGKMVDLASIILFFTENPSYVNYLITELSLRNDFEYHLLLNLKERGIENESKGFQYKSDGSGNLFIKDFNKYIRSVFCGVTIFVLIKGRENCIKGGVPVESSKSVAQKIESLILKGFFGAVGKDNVLFPESISESRKTYLDSVCHLKSDDLPPENRFFVAFASVIKKYKFSGVTIERIADELGMAKSSLYEYFANKNELVKTLIIKEMSLLDSIVQKNCTETENTTENIYVVMHTEFFFFQLRPSSISILGWLLMNSMDDSFIRDFETSNFWIEHLEKYVSELNLGFPLHARDFISWISSLPISLTVQCVDCSLDTNQLLEGLKQMFSYAEYGIEPAWA